MNTYHGKSYRLWPRRRCFCERRHGLFEPFAEFHGFRGRLLLLRTRLTEDRRDELVARAAYARSHLSTADRSPTGDDQPNGDQPREFALERTIVAEREVRPGVPDEDRDQQKANASVTKPAASHEMRTDASRHVRFHGHG